LADRAPRVWPAADLRRRPGATLPGNIDDQLALVLDDLDVTAVEPADDCRWRVHFTAGATRDAAIPVMAAGLGQWLVVSSLDIPDEAWARQAQASLRAVRAGRIMVAPPWDVPAAGTGAPPDSSDASASSVLTIVIEPSMGFGTGHHPSTRLCLRLLQGLTLAGRRVVDMGTGSGVLAIATARLGASSIVAIDHDPDAVQSARENVARNGLAGRIQVCLGDLAALDIDAADIVLANLTMAALLRFRDALVRLVAPAGMLVASGFTRDQAAPVLDAFGGLDVAARDDEDDWVALALRKG
jgi:ribosomal protein L11 methyltransferase